MSARLGIASAAALLALGVAAGAFAAHGLRGRLSGELLAVFQTAVQYHLVHGLGLLAIGVLRLHWPDSAALAWAGWLLLAGILLFSGSLYLLALTGSRWLGGVTPLGGAAFIAGWVALVWAALQAR